MMDMDRVPWLSRGRMEEEAECVLARAREALGAPLAPPIPIEAIIEEVFGYELLVEDLHARYAHLGLEDRDLLGATVVPRRRILVHDKLLHDPKRRGRFFFTCAHELAHVVLHGRLVEGALRRGGNQGTAPEERDILCRISQARKRGEWQADYMAACLLMPAAETREAYRQAVSEGPTVLVNRASSVCKRGRPLWLEPVVAHAPFYAEAVIEAGRFTNVSKAAMRIRLEQLGLLVNAAADPWAVPARA